MEVPSCPPDYKCIYSIIPPDSPFDPQPWIILFGAILIFTALTCTGTIIYHWLDVRRYK